MSRLTQWIEDAEARDFRRDASWDRASAMSTDTAAAVLMNTMGPLFWLALILAPIVARF